MRAWRQHWNHQLYKTLEHQYQTGLEALNKNLPEIHIDLIFKSVDTLICVTFSITLLFTVTFLCGLSNFFLILALIFCNFISLTVVFCFPPPLGSLSSSFHHFFWLFVILSYNLC